MSTHPPVGVGTMGIRCVCGARLDTVIDSRLYRGFIRRRRECSSCGERASTREILITAEEDAQPSFPRDVREIAALARAFAADVLELSITHPTHLGRTLTSALRGGRPRDPGTGSVQP